MKNRIKIFLVLGIAFLISQASINTVFLAGTPKLRQNLPQYLATRISSLVPKFNFPQKFFSRQPTETNNKNEQPSGVQFKNAPTTTQENEFFKPITKGVYAEEDKEGNIKKIEYRMNEIDWVEYTFTVNGKEVKVKIPKGQPTPPANILEKMYQ